MFRFSPIIMKEEEKESHILLNIHERHRTLYIQYKYEIIVFYRPVNLFLIEKIPKY